jgi:hypothetical protein
MLSASRELLMVTVLLLGIKLSPRGLIIVEPEIN